MLIEALRVVDNRLPTPEGDTLGPTVYYMDVAVNEEEIVAVPISSETFVSLTDITAQQDPPLGNPETPMGIPS